MNFLEELKRRRVVRVAGVYAAVAFVIWQAADIAFPALHLPGWMVTAVVALSIIGFPIALVLAWAFDITPEGVVRTDAEDTHVVVSSATLRTQRIVAAAGVLVLGLGGGAVFVLSDRGSTNVERSIAVLPFANLSGDADNEFFSDGITEDILTQLAKVAELKVISRSSVMAYKGTILRPRQIGEELDVAHLVEGSVRRDGTRVRISAQLVDARSDRQLWAETYDRELTGIFEIQSEIAQQIARALQARLSPAEQTRLATVHAHDLSAYELYMKAREARGGGTDAREQVLAMLSESLRLDPRLAPAYAEYVRVFVPLNRRPTPAELDSAARVARRAVELAPERADGYTALGLVMRRSGRPDEAEQAYRRAFALAPGDIDAIGGMGWVHTMRGEHDEALRWRKLAAELDPGQGTRHRQLGNTYDALGEYDRAVRAFERAVNLMPDVWFFHADLIYQHLRRGEIDAAAARLQRAQRVAVREVDTRDAAAHIALARGDTAGAIRLFEEANADPVRWMPVRRLALLYWSRGYSRHAERVLAPFERLQEEMVGDFDRSDVLYGVTLLHAVRGDMDAAAAHFERARQAGLSARTFDYAPLPDELLRDARLRRTRDAIYAERERQRERARRSGWL